MSAPYCIEIDDGEHESAQQPEAAESSTSHNVPELIIPESAMESYEGSEHNWAPASTPGRLQSDSYFTGNYFIDPALGEIQDLSSFENPGETQSFSQEFFRSQPQSQSSRLYSLRSHSQTFSTPPDTDSEVTRIPLMPPVATQSVERRRQQNRSAQRAFRERKESYTNRLENELTALRDKYDALVEALSGFRESFLLIEKIIEGHRAGSPLTRLELHQEEVRGKGKARGG